MPMHPDAPRPPLLIICGPTASGKSALALELARRFDGEIINADSVQVYRGFDIGTAKPGEAERRAVPHHLLDIVDPWEHYDGARFAADADRAADAVAARGHLPLVVGGTGLYLSFLLFGLSPSPPRDPALRLELQQRGRREGSPVLHAELAAVDPDAAGRIAPADLHRIVRALEVHRLTGEPLSRQHARHEAIRQPRYPYLALMPTPAREDLYAAIELRFAAMLAAGWLDEVRRLLDDPRCAASRPMHSLGYRQLAEHLAGRLTLDEAASAAVTATRQYAKRQLTWFNHQLPGLVGLPPEDIIERAAALTEDFRASSR